MIAQGDFNKLINASTGDRLPIFGRFSRPLDPPALFYRLPPPPKTEDKKEAAIYLEQKLNWSRREKPQCPSQSGESRPLVSLIQIKGPRSQSPLEWKSWGLRRSKSQKYLLSQPKKRASKKAGKRKDCGQTKSR